MAENHTLVDVDGWLTDSPEQLASWRAGRWSYAQQLAVDVRAWKPWLSWIVALACFGPWTSPSARATDSAATYSVLGVAILGAYFHALRSVVGGRQRARLIEVEIRFDQPHPLFKRLVTGAFVEVNGSTIGKAVVDAWAAERTRRPGGENRALVAFDPDAEFSMVVGLRGASGETVSG